MPTAASALILFAVFPLLPSARAEKPSIAISTRPRIAVIIDDMGLTYKDNPPDEDWLTLPFPLTFSVMPRSPRTRTAAKAAEAAGHEVMLHFPFDPFLKLILPEKATSSEDLEKIAALLEEALAAVPQAKGVDPHRSFRAVHNRPVMRWFMGELKKRGLYFVDARIAPKMLAYEEAMRAGLRTATSRAFLDEPGRTDKAFCTKWLRIAASHARRTGTAVVIGHHYHQGTLDCLREEVPALQEQGITFVHASHIVRPHSIAPQ